ncbi:MAG: GNAT family N-acetyltransferase, partial [Bdellovibrionota bacterium]
MNFRKANATDVERLDRLVNAAYRGESGMRGWTTEAHLLGGVRIDPERLETTIKSSDAVILLSENESGELLACGQLTVKPGGVAFLSMLTVDVEKQTGGIGKSLLSECERFAKAELKCGRIEMFVIEIRKELVSWYERRGYKRTGITHPFPNDIKFGIPLAKANAGVVAAAGEYA